MKTENFIGELPTEYWVKYYKQELIVLEAKLKKIQEKKQGLYDTLRKTEKSLSYQNKEETTYRQVIQAKKDFINKHNIQDNE